MPGNNDRIVIEVKDGVDSSITPKVKGIGDAARRAHDQIVRLQKQLNSLNASGLAKYEAAMAKGTVAVMRQSAASERLAQQQAKTATAMNNAAVAAGRVAAQNERTAAAAAKAGLATEKLATQQQRTAAAAAQAAAAQARATQAQVQATAAAARTEVATTKAAVAQEKLAKAQEQTQQASLRTAAAQSRAGAAAQALAAAEQRTAQAVAKTAQEQAKLTVVNNRAAQAATSVATAEQRLASATTAASTALQRQTAATAQAAAAQARLQAAQDATAARQQINQNRIAQSAAQAAAAQERLNRVREQATRKTNDLSEAERKNAERAKYGSKTYKEYQAALRGMPAQITDIVVSLQGGQAPLTVLLQQGGQIKDMFGGIGPAIRVVGSLITKALLNPITWLAGGVLALGIAFAKTEGQIRTFNGQLARLQATGRTEIGGEFLKGLRQQLEDLPDMGRKSANAVIDSFVSMRNIGQPMMERMAKVVGDLGVAMGTDTPKAAERLAQALDNPIRGAEDLDKELGFLTASQFKQIDAMQKSGDIAGAQGLIMDALSNRIQGLQREAMTPMQVATTELGVAWNELKRSFGDTGIMEGVNRVLVGIVNATTWVIERFTQLTNLLSQWQPPEWLSLIWKGMKQEVGNRFDNAFGPSAGPSGAPRRQNDLPLFTPRGINPATQQTTENKMIAAGLKGPKPKEDKSAERRAQALAKVNLQLDNEIRLMGMVGPLREREQKFNQISEQLIGKGIDLSKKEYEATRKSIQEKIRALVEGAEQQRQMDRIYEESTGPLREYTATQAAAADLLKRGVISQQEYNKQLAASKEEYENAIDPMREYNIQMQQELQLAGMLGPQRDIASKLLAEENRLRALGLPLTDAMRQKMQQELETLRLKTMVQDEYNQLLQESTQAQEQLAARTQATTMAYQNGLIALEQYQIRLNRIKVEQADIANAAGFGTWETMAIGAIGRVTESYEGMFSGLSNVMGTFMSNMADGFANSIGQWIIGAKSLREALGDVARQALSQLIAGLVKLGIQYALNAALGTSMAAAMTAGNVAMAATVATAWAPAAALVSLASFGTNSLPAATALTTTTALAEGIALMSKGFKSGGYTGNLSSNDAAGVVHGREFVFDAHSTARIGVGNLMAMQSGADMAGASSEGGRLVPVGNTNVNVVIRNEAGPGVDFEVHQITERDVEIIAKRVVQKETDNVTSQNIHNPNSKTSRSMARNIKASRRVEG